jgi:hypothetical protein
MADIQSAIADVQENETITSYEMYAHWKNSGAVSPLFNYVKNRKSYRKSLGYWA